MKSRKGFLIFALCTMLFLWFGFGCEEDEVITNGQDEDCVRAAELVNSANDSLASQMDVAINQTLDNPDSSFRPRDIDFTGVYALYNEAALLCDTNIDAKFGAAFTGMLTFLTDTELNTLIDRIKYVVDTIEANSKIPLPLKMLPHINVGGPLAPEGIPLTVSRFGDVLPSLMSLDYGIMSAAGDDPVISEVQAVLENSLLPRITTSRSRITEILSNTGYTFTITPAMQGNSGADSVILDRTDFKVFQAILYAAEAVLHIACARDLDVATYTIDGLADKLMQDSSFLNLRSGNVGVNHMLSAKNSILSAKASLIIAADYLIAEIGTDQSYDLIEIPSNGAADINQFKDSLNHYFTYFDNPKELEIIWTKGWEYQGEPPVWTQVKDTLTMMVDISKFFDSAMVNPKQFLPDYTIMTQDLGAQTEVCFSWDANSYTNWTWPYPTFNGLLPEMTSQELKELIMNDSTSWKQSFCDTITD
jgi:hypothetical protein